MKITCSVLSCGKIFDHYSDNIMRVQTDAARLGWWWRGSAAWGRQWYCGDHPRVVRPDPVANRPVWPTPPAEPAAIRVTSSMRRLLAALLDAEEPLWTGDLARSSKVPYGSVYAMLRMLIDKGWVTAGQDPMPTNGASPRHLYQLTPAARELAADIVEES